VVVIRRRFARKCPGAWLRLMRFDGGPPGCGFAADGPLRADLQSTDWQLARYPDMKLAPTRPLIRSNRFGKLMAGWPASLAFCALLAAVGAACAAPAPLAGTIELHQKLVVRDGERAVALTLDACGGGFDLELVDTLVELRVAATVFVTRKWIERHPEGMAKLKAHPELFAIEDHGAAHVPAVIGADRRIYGLRGVADLDHVRAEVTGGAQAIAAYGIPAPRWYRGATAVYDASAIRAIESMGYRIAGFSVNADAGATLPRREIVARLSRVQPGDIIIAHMNKPASESAEALRDALPGLLARGMQFVTLRGRAVQALSASPSRS
jgi:peptidoglycan/xylan/chitin deacetylase (PgdA/CDA1 family)